MTGKKKKKKKQMEKKKIPKIKTYKILPEKKEPQKSSNSLVLISKSFWLDPWEPKQLPLLP